MIAIELLARLALDDTGEQETAEIEEHVLGCGQCATTLERLVRIGDGVRVLVETGGFAFPVTTSIIQGLEAAGLVSRTYHLAPGGLLPCTVATTDIFALTTLEADLAGVTQASLRIAFPSGELRFDDIPFEGEHGVVAYVVRSAVLRQIPSCRVTLELHAVEPEARLLGRYFLDHALPRA